MEKLKSGLKKTITGININQKYQYKDQNDIYIA